MPNQWVPHTDIIFYFLRGIPVFLPIKDKIINSAPTEYEQELIKRNEHIFTKSLEGISNSELADRYYLSASSIRRIIREQRKGYEVMNNKICQIINAWDIERKEIRQIYDSAWQVGEDFVLKTYKDINMLQRNIKVLHILDSMEIPIGGIVLTKDKKTYAKDDEYYYILTNKLSGSNITDIHKNTAIASEMGCVLAKLHKALKKCETQDDFWNNSLLKEMKGWIRAVFVKNNWKYIDERKFDDTVKNLENLYDKLPVQLIHRDVHLGNFLFDKGSFSGYIDFDLSQKNIRIFDFCYFMLGLISEEKLAVPYVMESIELLFAAWFMEQSDMKCAGDAMRIYRFVEKNIERILKTIS